MKTESSAQKYSLQEISELVALHLQILPEQDRKDALQSWVDENQGPNCLTCNRQQVELKVENWLELRAANQEVSSHLERIKEQTQDKKEQAELAFNFLNTTSWQS